MFESGRLDRDLVAQRKTGSRSNRGRRFWIGRLGCFASGSGGGTRRRRVPAAARGENSPEMAEIGHPGVETTGFLGREDSTHHA